MARVWTTGFEMGNAVPDVTTVSGAAVSTTTPYSGTYHLATNTDGSWTKTLPAAVGEFYFRFRWRYTANPFDARFRVLRWYKGGTLLGYLTQNLSTHKIEVGVNATLVATGTHYMAINTWYLIEVHVKIADSGNIDVKIDGATDITYAGDTQPGADTTVDTLNGYAYSGAMNYDDIALNDTSGGADNSWPGDGRIIALLPNGAGTYTEWTPNTGANYAAVDERGMDSDTTYVYESVVDQKDSYALAACGLPAATTSIKRVWTDLTAKGSTTGCAIAAFMSSGGHEHVGSDQVLTTGYLRYVGADELVEPNGGLAWTPTDLDALEIGAVVRA